MYFVIDVGGTKMRLAKSSDGIRFFNTEIIETPPDFESAVPIFNSYFDGNLTEGGNNVCCGLPGLLDQKKEILLTTGHLPFWVKKPVKETLQKISGAEVYLENDANLAGLGEAVRGAGIGKDIVGFLTVGTGVGGVRIVESRIDNYFLGTEPGHQIIDADGTIAGKSRTLDSLIGGAGVKARFGKQGEDIKDPHVWTEVEKLLSVGIANAILFWSPEILILGGSLMNNEFISVESIKKYTTESLKIVPALPEIKKGLLGDYACLYGGLEYIKQQAS